MLFGVLTAILSPGTTHSDDGLKRVLSLLAEERYSEARELLDPMLRRGPARPHLLLTHGVLSAREGDVREAIAIFEGLQRDHPDMFEPYNNLAVLYAKHDRLEDARNTLLVALERNQEAVLYANLGDVYMNLARRAYICARELNTSEEVFPKLDKTMSPIPMPPVALIDSSEGLAMGVKQSRHVSDLQRSRCTSLVAPKAVSSTALSVRTCVHAGGFNDHSAAAEAAQWLWSRGAEIIDVRQEERLLINSHRVYISPLPNRKEATAKVREIRNRGVRDIAIIPYGFLANGISMGVYNDKSNMRRRIAELEQLGYSVESVADTETISEYIIRARVSGPHAVPDVAWTSQFPGHSIRYVDCR